MSVGGAYLLQDEYRIPYQYTPEFSRRARGIEVWAALRQLGRLGLTDLIERTCRHAGRFAEGLVAACYRVLNDVVLNQVLVSFGSSERTREVIARVQDEGTCWCGGTVWQGHTAMRISVSSWANDRGGCGAQSCGYSACGWVLSRRRPDGRDGPEDRLPGISHNTNQGTP